MSDPRENEFFYKPSPKELGLERITTDNVHTLRKNDRVRAHNGYCWFDTYLDERDIEMGTISNGNHNERERLLNPDFGGHCYIVKRAEGDYQI
jgi:hypothetical protein